MSVFQPGLTEVTSLEVTQTEPSLRDQGTHI